MTCSPSFIQFLVSFGVPVRAETIYSSGHLFKEVWNYNKKKKLLQSANISVKERKFGDNIPLFHFHNLHILPTVPAMCLETQLCWSCRLSFQYWRDKSWIHSVTEPVYFSNTMYLVRSFYDITILPVKWNWIILHHERHHYLVLRVIFLYHDLPVLCSLNSSHLLTEVKQHRAWLVLGWVTVQVLAQVQSDT